MPALAVRGLVRAARRATEELRVGLPESERSAFGDRLQRDLRWVEGLLAKEGLREADLPAPSRRAVDVLRRIAAIPLSELPDRPEGSAPARRLRLEGAEGLLGRLLGGLERGDAAPEILPRVRLRAEQATCAAVASCRIAGVEPDALTPRSRRAFAMLRWLSEADSLVHGVGHRPGESSCEGLRARVSDQDAGSGLTC